MQTRFTRKIVRWLRTRERRQLWWSIPVLLACLAWMVLGFFLLAWQPGQIEGQYAVLAQESLSRRDFETSRIATQRLLALGAESRAKWLFNLALADAGLGRDKEASTLFAAVAPLNKAGYEPAHIFLAHVLLMKTNVTDVDIKTAEQHFINVLSVNEHSATANEFLARLYIRNGQWSLAIERLRKIAPNRPETQLLLAAALKAHGDLQEALTWAEAAVKYHREKAQASPTDQPKHRLAWEEGLVMLGDYAEALTVLTNGMAKSGDRLYPSAIGEVCASWAQSIAAKKPADLETRMDILQTGLQHAPQNQTLLKQLVALSHLEGPQAETARKTLNKILAEGKSTAVVHLVLGMDAWQQNQPAITREHFAIAYQSVPQMPDIANNMALILAVGDKPDLPKALAIVQSLLDKYPNQPNIRDTRGQIYVKMQRWQEAVLDLEFALPKLVSTRMTHEALAEAYRALGSQPLAAQHLRLAKASGEPSTNPQTAKE